jgi:hypothetical protein
MTLNLDRFLRQWSFCKRCLLLFFAVNVFSVVAALVLGLNFFVFKKDLNQKQKEAFERIVQLDLAAAHVSDLLLQMDSKKDRGSITIRTREDEIELIARLEYWHQLKANLTKLAQTSEHSPSSALHLNANLSVLVGSNETRAELTRIREELAKLKANEWHLVQERFAQHNNTARLLIWTGLLTLFFGLVLPCFAIYAMGRALNAIRVEMQNTAISIVKTWSETQASFGDGAFKNLEFWLQVLLLVGSYSSKLSAHPTLQVTGELAHIVRLELLKKQKSQDVT